MSFEPEVHVTSAVSQVRKQPVPVFRAVPITEDLKDALAASIDFEALGGPAFDELAGVCLGLLEFLGKKNRAYGNSALDPVRVFARDLPADVQIRVRLDDKLNRLRQGHAAGEDVIVDLAGYLVLLLTLRVTPRPGVP